MYIIAQRRLQCVQAEECRMTTRLLTSVTVTLVLITAIPTPAQDTVRFAVIGDYGNGSTNEGLVATLVNSWNPQFVITTGDNSYGASPIDFNIGQFYSAYIGAYTGTYGTGSLSNRFFPSLGNHDYTDGGGLTAYLNYFTLPGAGIPTTGTSGNERYYDFTAGPVQFFAINSNFQEPSGITSNSAQAAWLQTQLTQSSAVWKIVYMHHPPYSSSSNHGSDITMQWPYENWGVSIMLTGHDHTYERLIRDDNQDGRILNYVVNGLGGRSIYAFPSSGFETGSLVRYNANYGAMRVTATDTTMHVTFWSITGGGTMVDSVTLRPPTGTCCRGVTGNIDADPFDLTDGSDLQAMVDYIFFDQDITGCFDEADMDRSGSIDGSELQILVDLIFFDEDFRQPCP